MKIKAYLVTWEQGGYPEEYETRIVGLVLDNLDKAKALLTDQEALERAKVSHATNTNLSWKLMSTDWHEQPLNNPIYTADADFETWWQITVLETEVEEV